MNARSLIKTTRRVNRRMRFQRSCPNRWRQAVRWGTSNCWPGRRPLKTVRADPRRGHGDRQRVGRIVDALIGQLEGAEVMADAELGTAQVKAFDRFLRVLMLGLHEPARLIGADRKDGETDVAVFFTDRAIRCALGKSVSPI